jgi:hypothetical protein
MPVDKKVKTALQRKNLSLPLKPRVLSIEAENYVDWTGDDALRVWVTIAETTTDEELLDGSAAIQLFATIHDSLRKHGIALFPYIRVGKPSERAGNDEEE